MRLVLVVFSDDMFSSSSKRLFTLLLLLASSSFFSISFCIPDFDDIKKRCSSKCLPIFLVNLIAAEEIQSLAHCSSLLLLLLSKCNLGSLHDACCYTTHLF